MSQEKWMRRRMVQWLRWWEQHYFVSLGFGGLQLRIRFPAALLAHRLAAQLNAIGIVDQPIHNAVGDAGITDLLMPVRNGQLTGEDGRASLVTIITDLEKVATFVIFQRRHGEVVEYQHIDARQLQQELADAAVG